MEETIEVCRTTENNEEMRKNIMLNIINSVNSNTVRNKAIDSYLDDMITQFKEKIKMYLSLLKHARKN